MEWTAETPYVNEKILVVDSEDDNSIPIINNFDCELIIQKRKGYGSAIIEGFKKAKNKFGCIYNADYSFISNPKKENIKKSILGIITRMKNSYQKRAEEAGVIKEHIIQSPYPLIVCGDFNDTPLSYSYHAIKGKLTDAFSRSGKGIGNSFVKIPTLRIDYILHDNEFKSTNYQRHNQVLSDHYAVSCEITIP